MAGSNPAPRLCRVPASEVIAPGSGKRRSAQSRLGQPWQGPPPLRARAQYTRRWPEP